MALKDDFGPPWRVPLLLLAFISLFLGIDAGLARLGWASPGAALATVHGPLMASGFFGTVISLERAVALGRRWAYAAPLAAALSALAAMLTAPSAASPALALLLPPALAPLLSAAGSLVMLAASLLMLRRQRELFILTMALGAACWCVASFLWLAGRPVHALVPWWIAFLVLTIAGERLELSRLLPPSPVAKRIFALLLAALLGGVTLSLADAAAGTQLLGFALAGLALWLMRQDVARRTIKTQGLTRFIAACLLSGYVWLAVGGVSMLVPGGLGSGGAAYDAALHALLLGFVFSMVFGHAPIIFPAVLRVAVPYHPYFYAPLALLHASLAIRVAGDWLLWPGWRAWGGMLNGIALVAFVAGTIAAVIGGRLAAARQSGSPRGLR